MGIRSIIFLLLLPVLAGRASDSFAQAVDLLPDLVVRQNDLYDHDFVTDQSRRYLRLSNGTANIGDGRLFLFGNRSDATDSLISINQRISRSDSSAYDRLAGYFEFHPGHDHIHVNDWALYRLREILPGDSVGPVAAEGPKTSFCVFDGDVHDSSLPNFSDDGEFFQCYSNVQGLSVGWIDVYTKDLPGQQIDITDLPDGVYWLESIVDPLNNVRETDDSNNLARIKILIGNPRSLPTDRYEPNDSAAVVDIRPVGGPNSPRLGPCDPVLTIENLSIDNGNDVDLFKFFLPDGGVNSDRIELHYDRRQGDLDLQLLDNYLNVIANSTDNDDDERISFMLLPAGWYYARIFSYLDDLSPAYTLSIFPPANDPATITLTSALASDTVLHGLETYRITWNYSDPETLPCWVTVYLNTLPTFDGREILLPNSVNTDAALGFFQINSAYLDVATYWIYCEITDGGTRTGAWSPGTVTFVQAGGPGNLAGVVKDRYGMPIPDAYVSTVVPAAEDSSDSSGTFELSNLAPTRFDIRIQHPQYRDTVVTGIRVFSDSTISKPIVLWENCPTVVGDLAEPFGQLDISDALILIAYLIGETENLPASIPVNINGSPDSEITMADFSFLITYLFRGGAPPVCPDYPQP
jgi:hypothetical protein